MLERIQETAAFLKGKMHTQPETAIILGTGLGSLAGEITEKYEIRYEEIPNFPVSTVETGKLGISSYFISYFSVISPARLPSPVPRIIAVSGCVCILPFR